MIVSFPPYKERENEQKGVEHDGGDGVQRMKTDGASSGIVDWVGQQMVCINKHCRNHDHCCIAPAAMEERDCNQRGHKEVQYDMNHVCDVM